MSTYQLPPLKNEQHFENFICDLFNAIGSDQPFGSIDFQHFGVKGQKQKGIDIISAGSRTVIQCKVKDLRKKDDIIRKNLLQDISQDLELAAELQFTVARFIFVSTFRDDSVIQEFLLSFAEEHALPYTLQYWGWDTLSKYAEQYKPLIKKHFPKFAAKPAKMPSKPAVQLPEGALGLDLGKKNYISYLSKRYGDWKQLQLDQEGGDEKFNWASHNKSLMNRYHAAGINHIPVVHFEDLAVYLQGRIDKTIFGRSQKARGRRNYSTFEEHHASIPEPSI